MGKYPKGTFIREELAIDRLGKQLGKEFLLLKNASNILD